MARLQCVDLRKLLGAIGRESTGLRTSHAGALADLLVDIGGRCMGAPDESVGCDSSALVRRIVSTVGYLRRMERPDWVPGEGDPLFEDAESPVAIDMEELARQEAQHQAEEHGRRGRGKASAG